MRLQQATGCGDSYHSPLVVCVDMAAGPAVLGDENWQRTTVECNPEVFVQAPYGTFNRGTIEEICIYGKGVGAFLNFKI